MTVKVTQAARDAAADHEPELTEEFKRGDCDHWPIVQAFAKLEASAYQRGQEDMREQGQREGKAAVLHWLRGRSAKNPRGSLWWEAEKLADEFEASEQCHTSGGSDE
jgi:hypothetical protein